MITNASDVFTRKYEGLKKHLLKSSIFYILVINHFSFFLPLKVPRIQ